MSGIHVLRVAALSLAFLPFAVGAAAANSACSDVSRTGQKVKVTPGPQYKASGVHRMFFGGRYRDLWTTPIEVPVLDLQSFAGGLTAKEKAGGKQTKSLKLEGQNGRRYRFRSTDKYPKDILDESEQSALAQKIIEDQTGAAHHPAGALVVSPLSGAAGLLHVSRCLVVLPDDPTLGEFRAEYAGMLGTLEETPGIDPVTPGFEGVVEIVDSGELFKKLDASPADRIDARAFLKARLFDMLVGDWDRHKDQFDWARRSEGRWLPIPKDRDQVFASYEGLLPRLASSREKRLVNFKHQYPQPIGLTWNSRDLSRRLLAELEEPIWKQVALELQEDLSDSVIDAAVAQMPPELHRKDGARLAATLKARRDRLPEQARRFYLLVSRDVEVHATDAHELANVHRHDSGEVEVTLAPASDPSVPYFRRRFVPGDTEEIRLFLRDGNDRAVTRGQNGNGPTLRIIGGNGKDVLDESAGAGTRLYDSNGENEVIPGNGTKVDLRPAPEEKLDKTGNRTPLEFGGSTLIFPWVDVETDIGLLVGAGVRYQGYGFWSRPYRQRHLLKAEYATAAPGWRADYEGEWRRINSPTHARLLARASEIEVVRFYGFGNETQLFGPSSFYHVDQNLYSVAPSLVVPRGSAKLTLGAVAKYATTRRPPDRFISSVRPYGTEDFGQVGAQGGFEVDTREPRYAARRGVLLRALGSVYPPMWSVDETFGEAHGEAALHIPVPVPVLRPSLAFRVGGKRLFGQYPFHEAAFLGGSRTLRGLSRNRYAGDAMAFGNAELRFHLGKLPGFPVQTGLFALADTGRVFLDDESSDRWHTSLGGGLWFSLREGRNVLSLSAAKSEGHLSVYLKGGLAF